MLERQIKEFDDKQKAYVKAYTIMCVVVFLSLSAYIYIKGSQYMVFRTAVATNNDLITVLHNQNTVEKAAYDTNKENFDKVSAEIEKKLKMIFPANDDYTVLTKQIDVIEEELNRSNDTFEISNIDYQSVKDMGNYSILPLRMNIKSSGENFTRFLHKIENSGALNDQVRLMDISSIRLSFQEIEELGKFEKMINFSVLINAYFQNQT